MNPFRTMLLSAAAFGLCAGAVPAQDPGEGPPRSAEVIRVLEKVRAQLAEKDLTPEQRKKLAEVLARTTAQIERAVDGEAERRDRERAVERELRDRQVEMENARRQFERQQAEMEREMANRHRELDKAREQLERELVKREAEHDKLRQELERAHAQSAEVRDRAEQARRQAEEARERAMREVERAEQARRQAVDAEQRVTQDVGRAMAEARRAERDAVRAAERAQGRADRAKVDSSAERRRVVSDEAQPTTGGITVVRSSDGNVVKGQVVRLDDVTNSKSSGGDHDVWVVQRGDSVAGIATRITGDADRWKAIVEANPHIDPSRLQVGARLRVPSPPKAPAAPEAPARYRFLPGAAAHPRTAPAAPLTAPPVENHVHTHVHHHYDGPAPAPKATPKPATDVIYGRRVRDAAVPAPKSRTTVVRSAAPQVRASAARGDDIRKMVDDLRKELRTTRAMVEELRKKLTSSDAPAGRIH